jgi:hypothetical protein
MLSDYSKKLVNSDSADKILKLTLLWKQPYETREGASRDTHLKQTAIFFKATQRSPKVRHTVTASGRIFLLATKNL